MQVLKVELYRLYLKSECWKHFLLFLKFQTLADCGDDEDGGFGELDLLSTGEAVEELSPPPPALAFINPLIPNPLRNLSIWKVNISCQSKSNNFRVTSNSFKTFVIYLVIGWSQRKNWQPEIATMCVQYILFIRLSVYWYCKISAASHNIYADFRWVSPANEIKKPPYCVEQLIFWNINMQITW